MSESESGDRKCNLTVFDMPWGKVTISQEGKNIFDIDELFGKANKKNKKKNCHAVFEESVLGGGGEPP